MADYIGAKATDAERMRELLRYANYAKVAEELGVHRATVARWAAGESVPSWAVKAVERLILGERKEAAPPDWAERLEKKVDEIRANQSVVANDATAKITEALEPLDQRLLRIARIASRLEALPPRSDEESDDPPAAGDRVGESPADPGQS